MFCWSEEWKPQFHCYKKQSLAPVFFALKIQAICGINQNEIFKMENKMKNIRMENKLREILE